MADFAQKKTADEGRSGEAEFGGLGRATSRLLQGVGMLDWKRVRCLGMSNGSTGPGSTAMDGNVSCLSVEKATQHLMECMFSDYFPRLLKSHKRRTGCILGFVESLDLRRGRLGEGPDLFRGIVWAKIEGDLLLGKTTELVASYPCK